MAILDYATDCFGPEGRIILGSLPFIGWFFCFHDKGKLLSPCPLLPDHLNSLTQLVPDGVHILDAATPGFELPGAVLTAAGGSSMVSPLTLDDFSAVARTYPNGQKAIEVDFGVGSTDPADFGVAMVAWNETTGFLQGVFDMGGVNSAATGAISVGALGSTSTDTYRVHLITSKGHLLTRTFVPTT